MILVQKQTNRSMKKRKSRKQPHFSYKNLEQHTEAISKKKKKKWECILFINAVGKNKQMQNWVILHILYQMNHK